MLAHNRKILNISLLNIIVSTYILEIFKIIRQNLSFSVFLCHRIKKDEYGNVLNLRGDYVMTMIYGELIWRAHSALRGV